MTVIGCDGSFNTMGYKSKLGQCSAVCKMDKQDARTGRDFKVVTNYRRNRGERYGQDHKGSASTIETDVMEDNLGTLADKGCAVDVITKDLDTPSAKRIEEVNKNKRTNTEKGSYHFLLSLHRNIFLNIISMLQNIYRRKINVNNRIYIFGGYVNDSFGTSDSWQYYDLLSCFLL